jgi:hypothetical protein
MKRLIVVAMLVFSLVFAVNLNAELIYDKVITKYKSYDKKTIYTYRTKDIKNLYASSFIRWSTPNETPTNLYGLTFDNKTKNGELRNQQSNLISFKIDGKLYKYEYGLMTSSREKTRSRKGYVKENVYLYLKKDFAILIANSKETLIRIGCCKDTSINQKFKDGIKEILSK